MALGLPQRSPAQVPTPALDDAEVECPSWDAVSDQIRASLMAGIKKTVQGWSSKPLDQRLICEGYAGEDHAFLSELAARQSCLRSKAQEDADLMRITIRRAEVARAREEYKCPPT